MKELKKKIEGMVREALLREERDFSHKMLMNMILNEKKNMKEEDIIYKSPLNYSGGKARLMPQLKKFIPQDIDTFYDLFTGGGNVAINVTANKIIANDYNEKIIEIYKYIQNNDINDVISIIEKVIDYYQLSKQNKDGFIKMRSDYNNKEIERPYPDEIMLFTLICYSFNHQFSFNKSGGFNTSFGKNRSQYNPRIKQNLINFSKQLKNKKIFLQVSDFRDIDINLMDENDYVYCDPPYLITMASYNRGGGWNEELEHDLLNFLDDVNSKGVRFGLSNVLMNKGKRNDILWDWSKKYNVHHLDYNYRNCNYHTKNRDKECDEVFITNY